MIVFWYLTRTVVSTFVTISMILMLIFLTNQGMHAFNGVVNGKWLVSAAWMMTLLQAPLIFSYIVPMSLFFSILFVLGSWHMHCEMLALAAGGFSRLHVFYMLTGLALCMMCVEAGLMCVIQPRILSYYAAVLSEAHEQFNLAQIIPGRFQFIGSHHVVYMNQNDERNPHQGVFFAWTEDQQKWNILMSQSIDEIKTSDGNRYVSFQGGIYYVGLFQTGILDVVQFQKYQVRLPQSHWIMRGTSAFMSMSDLWKLYGSNPSACLEFQWRIVNIVSVFLFSVLALPLSEVNPRSGRMGAFFPGIVIYIGYAQMMFMTRSWIEEHKLSVSIGLWWIPLALSLLIVCLSVFRYDLIRRFLRVGNIL